MHTHQVLEQKVVSREYHLRWCPWLRWARPLPPPTRRRLTESSEEYDCLHPLPVIPKLKHVHSMPLVPSAAEQRSPPNDRKKGARWERSQNKMCVTVLNLYICRGNSVRRSLSYPCDPAVRQSLRAQMVARQVTEWRRMTRAMEANKPEVVQGLLKPELKRSKLFGDTSIENVWLNNNDCYRN